MSEIDDLRQLLKLRVKRNYACYSDRTAMKVIEQRDDLLAALERLAVWDDGSLPVGMIAEVRAAISKAKGAASCARS